MEVTNAVRISRIHFTDISRIAYNRTIEILNISAVK